MTSPLSHWLQRALAWSWIVAAGAFLSGIASAQSPQEFAELRARLEILERQNAELRYNVMQRLPTEEHLTSAAADNKIPEVKKDDWYEVGTDLNMTAKWNNGLELSTKNKDFRVHVGGRYQFDVSAYNADQDIQQHINVPYESGVDFRRARFRIDGTMYETIEWAAEFDFIQGQRISNATSTPAVNGSPVDFALTAPTDLYWTFKEVPLLGNIRVGNQKEPVGFEHLVSSRWLPFLERSYNQDTYYGGLFNGFAPGIAAFNNYHDEWGYWHVGVYRPCDNVFAYSNNNGDVMTCGRLTHLLCWAEDGSELVHVGGSLAYIEGITHAGSANPRTERFRTRDAIRAGIASNWPVIADAGTVFGEEMYWANVEFAAVHGSWTVQAEYLWSCLTDARTTAAFPGSDYMTSGGYVQVLYYLTGEHDNYNRKTAVFERHKPHSNFFCVDTVDGCHCCGPGAWQVGVRYDYLDLNDTAGPAGTQAIAGGVLNNYTVGVNWFWNPNFKVQFNYYLTEHVSGRLPSATSGGPPTPAIVQDAWVQGWGVRFAHDF